jgi:hypothetical protein
VSLIVFNIEVTTFCLATSSSDTVQIIEKIYPIVEEFKCPPRYYDGKQIPRRRRAPQPPTNNHLSAPVSKQPRKTAPIYDPACSEFFEENMNLEEADEEEQWYEDNFC